MLPKLASVLSRVFEPLKSTARPGQSLSLTKSSEGGEGGHGPLGYEALNNPEGQKDSEEKSEEEDPEKAYTKSLASVPFQPGLTQVILDLNHSRIEKTASAAAQSYQTGSKEQKLSPDHAKGSKLYKKAS